jgi:glycosyltransferase involved in cell wall biosynthesis
MRQLHVIPHYEPATEFGGVQTVTRHLAEGMAARGHQVTVLTTDAASRSARFPELRERVRGVDVVRVRNLAQRLVRVNLFTPRHFRATVRTLLGEHDFVHVHDIFNWLTYTTLREAERARVPAILSTDNLLNFQGRPERAAARRLLYRLAGAASMRRATLVHAIREGEFDPDALGVPRERLRYIPNGVVYPPVRGDAARFAARHGLGDRAVVLYVGQLIENKGVRELMRVAERLVERRDVVFVFVGFRHPHIDLGTIPDNAVLTGFLTGSDLADAYAAGSFFVLPSYTDVMPNSALDALANGLPSVLSRYCGLDEVASVGAGVLVDTTVDDVERGVRALLDRRDEWPAMSAAAVRLVADSLALPRVHDRYEAMYEELLASATQ